MASIPPDAGAGTPGHGTPATGPGDLRPVLAAGCYVFEVVAPGDLDEVLAGAGWVALVREDEGVTVVRRVAGGDDRRAGGPGGPGGGFVAAMITLGVDSGLDWVGLTAGVCAALARRGIACNVVAGSHHDHLFVPADRAHEALAVLSGIGPAVWSEPSPVALRPPEPPPG